MSETISTQPDTAASVATDPAEAQEFIVDEATDEVLRLQLENFEGPFEVLLYLIKAQEIDIFDIPIVKVTEQYLRFLELVRGQNLDLAGEFLVLAATLIQIKAKMILPLDVDLEEDEEIEEEDPRLELVEKLLEYRRFRDLAQALGDLEEARAGWYPRSVKPDWEIVEDEEEYSEIGLYDLLKGVQAVLRFVTEPGVHEVYGEGATIEEKIDLIQDLLVQKQSIAWSDLVRVSGSKIELVCCLLAILELCRMRRIRVHQHQPFGELRLFLHTPQEEESN